MFLGVGWVRWVRYGRPNGSGARAFGRTGACLGCFAAGGMGWRLVIEDAIVGRWMYIYVFMCVVLMWRLRD